MQLSALLPENRIVVDTAGERVSDKASAIRMLAELLAPTLSVEASQVEQLLLERERLQSTAIGEGVAIPHAAMDNISNRAAALLLCPLGVEFDSLDGEPARIIFGVVGPRQATAEHLKVLARISRLLRDRATRERLLAATDPAAAHALVMQGDHEFRGLAP
jgi:PTS system nitrogen regulatory IIA component